jgi:ribosomal protein S18 acetylase RimI-like enzyme
MVAHEGAAQGNQAYRIRRFVKADQPAARQLVLEGLGEHFDFIDQTLNPDLDDINLCYLERGHEFVVAELDGVIVGTGALLREARDTVRMARISVSSANRRIGIARSIVRNLVQEAIRLRCRRIVVETNLDWYGAINLYLGEGFTETDRDDESVHMEYRLS